MNTKSWAEAATGWQSPWQVGQEHGGHGVSPQFLYLVRQGQRRLGLRNEIFSQLAAQLWHQPDEQQRQRGWALLAVLLGAFPPVSTLQKPLLK